ncbi:hypothetical protein APHCRT_0698 [Anaplasma phagocytophilum str. CRT53-1]|uniref:Uncharacterized protein n=1 Tax=Anaplasma phagocytophilum str. CRT53-1 TaxID=1359157 RepID=A0A0F3Q3Q7_ANAPH|nr:hypothetical protein APHCRT_0698 [Anaplasma phagocytophilum str. CRT53-1]
MIPSLVICARRYYCFLGGSAALQISRKSKLIRTGSVATLSYVSNDIIAQDYK